MTNTPTRNYIQPLEDALNFWEDKLCLLDAEMRLSKKLEYESPCNDPNVKNWSRFRSFVLERKALMDDFDLSAKAMEWLDEDEQFSVLPALIWGWNGLSRRVFHVQADLDLELRTTRLADITWNDIQPPFNSFIVTMDEPIMLGGMVQTIMCTFVRPQGDGKGLLNLSLFPTTPNGYLALGSGRRQQIVRAVEKGNHGMFRKVLEERNAYWQSIPLGSIPLPNLINIPWDDLRNRKVAESVSSISWSDDDTFDEEFVAAFDTASRIVVGMILHLQSLTPEEKERSASRWKPVRTNEVDTSAIFSEAEICTVSSLTKFTDEDREDLRTILRESKGGRELSTHMRAGYWRRKPGSGNDPGAPKCVRVRPARVRFDRIAGVAALPKGSESHV